MQNLLGAPPGNSSLALTERTTTQKFIPNYLRNPPLLPPAALELNTIRGADLATMPSTSLPSAVMPSMNLASAYNNDSVLVLKARLAGSRDPDFIELEVPYCKRTYADLMRICCEELEICSSQIDRIRKLPDTRLRKDNDVQRLKDFQSIEVVLKASQSECGLGSSAYNNVNGFQSISACKNQTIFY